MKRIITSLIIATSLNVGAQNFQIINNDWQFIKTNPDKQITSFNQEDNWQNVTIPHDWSILEGTNSQNKCQGPGGYYTNGSACYHKNLFIDKNLKNQKIYLYCQGIYMNSQIYVNGQLAGGHKYGYSSFFVDITNNVILGKNNDILINVDNSNQINCRWYSGSGIYRDVYLVTAPKTHFDLYEPFVTTQKLNGNNATINIECKIVNDDNKAKEVKIDFSIPNKNGKIFNSSKNLTIDANSIKTINQTIELENIEAWSPENPNLMTLTAKMSGKDFQCSRSVEFGVRQFEYSAQDGLKLNGKSIVLNGGCIHHDNGIIGAASYSSAEYRKAYLLKQGGFNAVRTSHNPPSPTFLKACDQLGLIVIDEAFDGWYQEKNPYDYSKIIDSCWRDDLAKMILRDRNHPSIFCWSIGNEIIERKSDSAVLIANQMRQHILSMDKTRPVTQALAAWDEDWEIYDKLAAEHDIIGYNYLIQKAESDHKRVPNRMIMQTESYPRDLVSNYNHVTNKSYVFGDFVWTAIDYLGESGIGRNFYKGETEGESWMADMYPWHGAACGDFDLIGNRKAISYQRDMLYNLSVGKEHQEIKIAVNEPNGYFGEIKTTMWSIYPQWESWTWPGYQGKKITVNVYSTAPKVKLMLNGKEIATENTTNKVASFLVEYQEGELVAMEIDNPNGNQTAKLTTAGTPAKIIINRVKASEFDPEDLYYIQTQIVDKDGNLCLLANNNVKFMVEGQGEIIATGNANLKYENSYHTDNCPAFFGKLLCIVRPKDAKNKNITITAQSPELESAKLTIK